MNEKNDPVTFIAKPLPHDLKLKDLFFKKDTNILKGQWIKKDYVYLIDDNLTE